MKGRYFIKGELYMAITADGAILAILKTWYKDGVENLLFRNSPVVKEIKKTRVEGKEQRFASVYSRGGAVAGNALVAQAKAAQNVKNAEFIVTPGQLFSIFSYNAKEVQASLSKKGAYMKVAGNKAFAATEALRKTLAAAFYGRGYGELAILGSTNAATVAAASAGASVTLELTDDVIMKIDVGSDLVLKTSISSATEVTTLTVTAIDGNNVTVTVGTADASAAATDVIALKGSMDGNGNPILPMGIDGWLPVVGTRTGSDWASYKTNLFFGVNRSVNVEGLMGSFYYDNTATKKSKEIQSLLQKCRRHGSQADFIIMNDNDWLDVAGEIEASNTYFTQTTTKGKRMANVGINKLSAGFSTNFIDVIYDDPYCPKGKFYIFDKADVELWAYTNSDAVNDGVTSNNPGKQNPEEFNDKGKENDNYKLIIDDFISAEPGAMTSDGPAVQVTFMLFGSYVVMNPSNAGVGIFHDATLADVVGYSL